MNSTSQKGMLGVVLALSIAVVLFVVYREGPDGDEGTDPNRGSAIELGSPQLVRVDPSSSIPSWRIESVWGNGDNEGYTYYTVELLAAGVFHSKYQGGEFKMANACDLKLKYIDSTGREVVKSVDVSSVTCEPPPTIDWSAFLSAPLANPFVELLPVSVLSDFELFLDGSAISPTKLRVELLLTASQGGGIEFDHDEEKKLYFKRS